MTRSMVTIDGNEAAAYIAFKTNEVIAIYPITPSTPMGESSDDWAARSQKNIWGTVPLVQEMQSEGGAAGACHGALQAGALTTTFTASQGLLLMIPNMYKIAGELTSTVFHVTARSLAAQALSIFGDHSDVMAVRQTGWGILFSNSVQEAQDMALIAQAATLKARVPFVHAFDGFRTSHEVMKIERLTEEDIRAMMDEDLVRAHRARALSPDHPVIRGTAQNPDVYFQARETVNPYYLACPTIVQETMDRFAELTGRSYRLFDYVGAPDAERVVVLMASGCEVAEETVRYLMMRGEKVGLLKARLFRPFSVEHLLGALPATTKAIAVLDRTKEPGAVGEPLYQDVVTAVAEGMAAGKAPFKAFPKIIGGRYGLSSKEFNPPMVKAVLDELAELAPKNHFTVGIIDDVTHTSLDWDPDFSTEGEGMVRALFWGLGSDGTVGANKNSIKIIGEDTPNNAQGYFVYDSKKSGGVTISHLRFGAEPIRSSYLIQKANFVAVHQFGFLEKYPVLDAAVPGATVLLNSPFGPEEVWDRLPRAVQRQIVDKKLKLYILDAYDVAKATGMGVRINTIMQVGFFALSGVLPKDQAIAEIKKTIQKTYGKRGEAVVQKNYAAVDASLDNLYPVEVPLGVTSSLELPPVVPPEAPEFVQKVTAEMIAGRGDLLPVSALPADGTYPTGTTQWEKRNIALDVPVWEPDVCIQCGKCVLVCPHACIRAKVYDGALLENAPATFKSAGAKWREFAGEKYTLQVTVEDCTGCTLCVEVCPAKDKSNVSRKAINMAPQRPLRETERENWKFFQSLPEVPHDTDLVRFNTIKNVQLMQPLFEFSGACAGCGETPYIKLLSQLFGDRALLANATGCSSIYGGNLPTTPYTQNREGRGPAWSNSLFEDAAEFGLGFRLTLDQQGEYARLLVQRLAERIGPALADALLTADQSDEKGITAQRQRVAELKAKLAGAGDPDAKDLLAVADTLVRKSVWSIGGDGWAYDIGYGGLDHVLSTGRDINLLVLDTEVYSNTGGQASKSTRRGAVAKFAAAGKPARKKDLGLMAMSYGNVYVATVAMGADDAHTVRVFLEAESYDGPSLIIAYSHCIAHGIDMAKGMSQQKLAVLSGAYPLYRYNPRLEAEGKNPFLLDSRAPSIPLQDYVYTENRYRMLLQSDPAAAARLLAESEDDVRARWRYYEMLAAASAGVAPESSGNGAGMTAAALKEQGA
jgi:pyruvate-ferredoxin/flavodoxin oxidoreductase